MHRCNVAVAGVFCLVTMLASSGCSGPKVYLAVVSPPAVKLPKNIKKIAVLPFGGNNEESMTYGKMTADQLHSYLFERLRGTGVEVVDRAHLKEILEEHDLWTSGITDANDAGTACKLLAIDAAIFGSVNHTGREYETTASSRFSLHRTALVREGMFSVSLKTIIMKTGKTTHSKTIRKPYNSRRVWWGSVDKTVSKLIDQCVKEFGDLIVPPSLKVYEIQMAGSGDEAVKNGNTLAKVGSYEDAAKQFQIAINNNPADHVAIYNLGVMKMLRGNLNEAEECFDKAVGLKCDEKYAWTRQRLIGITKAIKAHSRKVDVRPAIDDEINDAKDRKRLIKK